MPIASNRPSPRRAALAALLATATLALAACAGLQPKTPEDVVRERSEARWDALIKRDFDKAWEYTQPAYRALVGQKAASIVVDEQVQLAHRLRDRDQAEALVAKRRPAGDAEQLHRRERRFYTFGKTQASAPRKGKTHRARARTAERALGLLERRERALVLP